MRFRYFDPVEHATVEGHLDSAADVAELVALVDSLGAGCHPAVELTAPDGSSLLLGVAGERAVLLWTDATGQSSHSVGASAGEGVVFDYFGAYTELPGSYALPTAAVVAAAGRWVDSGQPPALALAAD